MGWNTERRKRLDAWLSNKPKKDFADLRAALAEIDRQAAEIAALKEALTDARDWINECYRAWSPPEPGFSGPYNRMWPIVRALSPHHEGQNHDP